MFTLGRGAGMGRDQIARSVESALPAIAGILLIVAAGGGFKQLLVDTGIGTLVAEWASETNISVHPAGLGAGGADPPGDRLGDRRDDHRVGLIARLVEGLSTGEISLMVLAIGAGSVFFSHVNDAGFWLVKEYFGLVGRPDHQDLVDHGDRAVGRRSGVRAAARTGDLTHDRTGATT